MKKLLPIIILFLLMISCNKTNDTLAIKKKISNMSSYSAVAEIIINGNKEMSEYKTRQFYSETNMVRIETIEPEFLKGKLMVSMGNGWTIYHPMINSSFKVINLKDDDKLIYLGIIQKNVLSLEDVEYDKALRDGIEYVTIKFKIPFGNEYRNSAILYVDSEEYNPKFMEILDNESNVMVKVNYSEFKYNIKLENSIFSID